MEILLKGIIIVLFIALFIVLFLIAVDMLCFDSDISGTLFSLIKNGKEKKLKKNKKTKKDTNTSRREELLKFDEKIYSIINRAKTNLTEKEKSDILDYVKNAHSCKSVSCFWLNRLSYITAFDGEKTRPFFFVGILLEKVEGPVVAKNRHFIKVVDAGHFLYKVSFVAYDFKEEFSGRNTLPLRLEEFVVTHDKYKQIMNNFVFRNGEGYMYLDLQEGDCLFYNSNLITIMSA